MQVQLQILIPRYPHESNSVLLLSPDTCTLYYSYMISQGTSKNISPYYKDKYSAPWMFPLFVVCKESNGNIFTLVTITCSNYKGASEENHSTASKIYFQETKYERLAYSSLNTLQDKKDARIS